MCHLDRHGWSSAHLVQGSDPCYVWGLTEAAEKVLSLVLITFRA